MSYQDREYQWVAQSERLESFRLLKHLALVVGVAVSLISSTGEALAQGAGQFERELSKPPAFPSGQGPTVPAAPDQKPPPDSERVRFTLKAVEFRGNKAYAESELRPLYAALLGREITLLDVYRLADRLTAKYRNDGYVLSRVVVPAQSIRDGVVQLEAVEGYVENARIQGSLAGPRSTVEQHLQAIRNTRPLNTGILERELLLLNDLPGLAARSTLGVSSTPGASDLTVDVETRRFSAFAGVNNRGSRSLGPWRADLGGEVNQLLWGYDRLNARLIQTLENELSFGSLGYDRAIGATGARWGLSGSYVRAKPGSEQNINLPTNSRSGTAHVSYPWLRSRAQNVTSRASFSYLNSETDLTALGGALQKDNIRAIRLGTSFDLVDRFRGVSVVDLEVSRGLEILGSSKAGDTNLSILNGRPDFSKVTLYAARLQSIVPKWSVLAAISAQHGANTLLSPERYAFGGEQFGRAYDSAEITGDSGAAFKTEFRFTDSTSTILRNYTAYTFYEIGQVHRRNTSVATAGQRQRESAANAGLGLRASFQRSVSGYVEFAQPLTRNVSQERDRDPRVFVGLQLTY